MPSAASIPALRQEFAFDVANWPAGPELEVFPEGTRDKATLFTSENPPSDVLRPSWRYLFKGSDRRFPDQFWGEIIAYRVGCLLGVSVPPAFAAWNSGSGESAALIEWFYHEGVDRLVLAGNFLQREKPDFDRRRGSDHNMRDNIVLLRQIALYGRLETDWQAWWANALAFDALIGNTDRHQDNWGFIISGIGGADDPVTVLTPLFDNGTSLGNERFPANVATWNDARWEQYLARGVHHVRWMPDGHETRDHVGHVRRIMAMWPRVCPGLRARFAGLTPADFRDSLHDLLALRLPIPLTPERLDLILQLLTRRLHHLQEAIL